MDNVQREMIADLIEAVVTLCTVDECERFFRDLCSEEEISRLSKRLQVAKLIVEGETYRDILEKTHTANCTISRMKNVMERENSILVDVAKKI